jgi:hypothetical protein
VRHPGNREGLGLGGLRATGVRRAVLAGIGLTLFLISFAGANPGGAVSDETDQYIKAIAAGHLDLLGTKVTDDQARAMDSWLPDINRILTSYAVYGQIARAFSIPSSLDPRYLGCTVEATIATCLDRKPPPAPGPTETFISSLGTRQPFIFIPAGLVMRLASNTTGALLLGRLAFALIDALLLLGALLVALRARPSPLTVAAIALCVAPTSVLVMSAISTSGPESAAGIAWWVALLGVSEPSPRRGAWWLALTAGLVLGTARTTGPLWMLLIVAAVVIFRGVGVSLRSIRAGGRLAATAIGVSAIAVIVTIVWQIGVQPASLLTAVPTPGNPSPSMIGSILLRGIATYGWGEAAPPDVIPQVWALMALVLVVLGVRSALARRARREIVALLAVTLGGVAIIAVFLAFPSEAGLVQGRWFIAPLAGIPILAGWVAASRPTTAGFERSSGIAAGAVTAGVCACLGVYWWLNEFRYAVNGGSVFFIGHTLWQPPLGWAPWLACAVLGLLALGIAGLPAGKALRPAAVG